jgi:hypothetical protein
MDGVAAGVEVDGEADGAADDDGAADADPAEADAVAEADAAGLVEPQPATIAATAKASSGRHQVRSIV